MRKHILSALMSAVLVLSFVAFVSSNANAQDAKRFDLTLVEADLQEATQMLSRASGSHLQFVFKPATEPYNRITLNLVGVSLDEAIRWICESAGAEYRKDSASNVFIIGPKGSFKEIKVDTGNETTIAPPVETPKVVRKIAMRHSHPKDVLTALFAMQADLLGEWRAIQDFRRMHAASIIGKGPESPVIVNSGMSFSPTYTPAATATSANEGGINVPGGSNQGLLGGGGGQLGGGGGQLGGGGGFGGGGQFGGGGFGGGFGGGGFGQGVTLQGGEGFIPTGIDRIIYDPTDNSLIVQGDDASIAQLERIIRQFDTFPKQVIIKVEFVTVTQQAVRTFGIDWLFQRGAIFAGNTPGTQARAGDPFFVNWSSGNLTTRLRTLISEGSGTIIDAPMVRTLNNQPAVVLQQIDTWVILTQVISTPGGQVITAPQLTPISVSTGLVVQPRINNDGYITMTINPQISQISGIVRGPTGEEAPIITSQTIFVTARVKNGETIVLGGLTHKDEKFTVQRFPILSELPIIGGLFKSTSKNVDNSELLILITPTVVEEEDDFNR